jgi:hypothetical protein
MSLNQKEKAIREKRTILAAQKNIMGVTGKLGTIAKYLGHEIKYQGSGLGDGRTMDEYLGEPYDVYAPKDDNQLPTFDERENFIEVIGYLFDGLSRGIHMEIKYMDDSKMLTVHWKGFMVYCEIAGELYAYAPFDEWESKVDTLYGPARKIAIKHNEEQRVIQERNARVDQAGFLQRLRMKWGI